MFTKCFLQSYILQRKLILYSNLIELFHLNSKYTFHREPSMFQILYLIVPIGSSCADGYDAQWCKVCSVLVRSEERGEGGDRLWLGQDCLNSSFHILFST